jgi:LPXTG-motif cell wall-anchored protein
MSGATVAAFGLLAFAAALAAGSLLLRRRRRA